MTNKTQIHPRYSVGIRIDQIEIDNGYIPKNGDVAAENKNIGYNRELSMPDAVDLIEKGEEKIIIKEC
jgi:hypothetical protein